MKDDKGLSLDHLRISKDDFEYRVGYDDSPTAMEESKRIAEEYFGGSLPNNVHITATVKRELMWKQSAFDRIRGLVQKRNSGLSLEDLFVSPELVDPVISKFSDIGGREFSILLLALRESQVITWTKSKRSMYGCFRERISNIGTDRLIDTYLSAYDGAKDIPGKRAITEDEVLQMQNILSRLK